MKQKIISILIGCSLLLGTVFANAVSIEFEDLIQEEIKTVSENENIIETDLYINEYSPKAIENYSDSILLNSNSIDSFYGYFKEADSITYVGQDDIVTYDNYTWVSYRNTSINRLKYVVYSNTVTKDGIEYDLVVYPFKYSYEPNLYINFMGYKYPGFHTDNGYAGYKLVITEHNNIAKPVNMNVIFGFADLDINEFAVLPIECLIIHQGKNLSTSEFLNGYIKYNGETMSNNDSNYEQFNTNCVIAESYFTEDGIIVYYGSDNGSYGTQLAFDEIKDYIDNNAYNIQFDINGGDGNIPTHILKFGDNSSTILGNIDSTIPTKEGYTFKGWSANPKLNDKRVAHTAGNTGAIQTNSSWTYADYCNNTGGNASNRTLTLYAQWEANTSNLTINPNGGTWNNSTDKQTFIQDYNSIKEIPVPTRNGYIFVKWNKTGTNGTMSSLTSDSTYTFGSADGVTDTLTAEWKAIDYSITYNLNDGTVSKENPITYTIETNTFTLNNPVKKGYTFLGWTGSNGTIPQKTISIPKGSIEDKNYIANYQVNQYPVTYIDVDSNGNEINRITKLVDYDTLVKGSELGDNTSDNAYYPQYKYVSDTSDKVTTNGAIVYRIFEFCETEAEANLQWNDNNNLDGFRPSKYKLTLKQNGIPIDEVELPSDTTNYTFSNLPKYDSFGNPYKYSFNVDATERYKINFDEDGNLIVEDYQPASFSVIIPKTIVLDGSTGKTDYIVSVTGTFYYNDTLTVIPERSLLLTDKSNISSMKADISLNRTVFMKEDNISEGTTTNGTINTEKQLFAGSWTGNFNFDIKFIMKN